MGPDGVTPIPAVHEFTFGVNTNPAQTAGVQNGETYGFVVPSGTWTLEEQGDYINDPSDWQLIDVVCFKGQVEVGSWDGYPDTDVSGLTVAGGDSIDCTFTNQAGPLAVTLASFTAEAQPATGVVVAWETVSNQNILGFNLYRGASESGPWTQLNPELIGADFPGASVAEDFEWIDTTAEAGATYWYRLEDVSLNGATASHPPMMVVVNAPTAVRLVGLGAAPR